MKTIILGTRLNTVVTVLKPEVVFTKPEVAPSNSAPFENLWHRVEADFNKPRTLFSGRERRIAQRLALRWPLSRLRPLMVHFHRTRYAEVREQHINPIVWFAHELPEMEKDLDP